jgi:sialic acid synthase SpsE
MGIVEPEGGSGKAAVGAGDDGFTPDELGEIVRAMEQARCALGSGVKVCQAAEVVNVAASRRGLYARRTLRAGERVSCEDVIALRPATRVSPTRMGALVGVTLQRDVTAGAPFDLSDLAG